MARPSPKELVMGTIDVKLRKMDSGRFQVYFTHPVTGKRIRKRLFSQDEAKDYKRQIEKALDDGYFEQQAEATIQYLMDDHLDKCPESRVMERFKHYLSFMDRFGELKLKDLNIGDLKEWFEDTRADNDLTDNTMNAIKGNLNNFFNYLVDQGIMDYSPLTRIKFKRNAPPKKERVFFTQDELKIILDNARDYSPDFLYPLFFALILTGARRQEIIELKWSDVDFDKNKLTLRDTKNGSNHTLRLSKQLRELIEEQKKTSEYVFTNPKGKMIGRSQLHRHIVCFKVHYPMNRDWGCHAFRHSFAWNYLQKGGKIHELQALLNHKTLELTVSLYGKIRAEDITTPTPYDF